jgi:hypothetical protein
MKETRLTRNLPGSNKFSNSEQQEPKPTKEDWKKENQEPKPEPGTKPGIFRP